MHLSNNRGQDYKSIHFTDKLIKRTGQKYRSQDFPTGNIFISTKFRKLLSDIRQKDLIIVLLKLIFVDISIVSTFVPSSLADSVAFHAWTGRVAVCRGNVV